MSVGIMSIKELKFDKTCLTQMRVNSMGEYVIFIIENDQKQSLVNVLDHNQAELLRLWLEEHLKK